jgi:hypothetical protein
MDIMKYVTACRSQWTVPLVVFGAFGTGKTETLAQAAVLLSKCGESDVRILICTHTNRLTYFDSLTFNLHLCHITECDLLLSSRFN